MSRAFVGGVAFVGLCLASAHAQEEGRALRLGETVERELAGGQMHTYTVSLAANQIARITAEQKGVDVELSVIGPDGARLVDIDSPNGATGEESASVVARPAGIYRVHVRAIEKTASAGRYGIRLERFMTETEYVTERLAGLARAWGAVKFFHPFLAYKDIDWDGAVIKAIPEVKAARTPGEYRAALTTMLRRLEDSSTSVDQRVSDAATSRPVSAAAKVPVYFRVVNDFVIVHATDWASAMLGGDNTAISRRPQMLAEIEKAKGIVIDCRYDGISQGVLPGYYLGAFLDNVVPSLLEGSVPLGTERYRIHSGYAPQLGTTSGGYLSMFVTQAPGTIVGQAKGKKLMAVLIDDQTPKLSPLLSALQSRGARIVQVGRSGASGGDGARIHPLVLPDSVRVSLRVSEFVHPGGGSTFQPDVRLSEQAGAGDAAIDAAITSLSSSGATPAAVASTNTAPVREMKDDPYPQMSFPTEEYRLLALFRFWNIINYFYPYKQLTDQPWGTVLTDFIPRFLENRSALDYETTVAEMIARMQDSHGGARLRNLDGELGTFAPPIRLASAGGRLAVVELVDALAAQTAGIQLGDVILAIDGVPVGQRLAALARLRALSTPQSAYVSIYPTALRGAKGTSVTLQLEGSDGGTRNVELTRTAPLGSVAGMVPRKTPIYRVLPNGYGYIDLARLPLAEAHKALDAVLSTPATIFDMRGYPNGTAWALAPRLGDRKNPTAALFRRPLQAATNFDDEDLGGGAPDVAFEQKLPSAQGAIYKGSVVMLINEFAISQSEHTCLFFETATSVTFIGSPTNGANGDVTNLTLPGGIYVSFTGHDVRHADGRQLQRIGIQPHVRVEPTVTGIREGRDEVLEAAVKYLDGTRKK